MPKPSDETLISWQRQLEETLIRLSDAEQSTARISEPDVHDAAAAYLIRPSKRLLGMAFLHAAHVLGTNDFHRDDLIAVAAALEIRHGAILLHDDIVDGDTRRGGHPTAHHALRNSFGAGEAGSAALFAGDILASLAPLPIVRSNLPAAVRARLCELFQANSALVAAGQIEQLHLDVCRDVTTVREADILRIHALQFVPYLMCSIELAGTLAGLDHTVLSRMTKAGIPLCQGFQVQNDLAGFTELARVLGSDDVSEPALTLANTSDLARRRRTVLVRAALDRLAVEDRDQLAAYFAGADVDLKTVVGLVGASGAADHCSALIADLHRQARERISTDPELPAHVRTALTSTWEYMTALYDPDSPTSRLYLRARPDLNPAV
ncbi:polyprenyl synthetase family protein [Streptomyces scopuliridis]|uniref:polyprenyl synthetase family protein n=1 Tax=Streptomyces scopuliridis TaxID=452529 RepID=UPI0036C03780